MPLKNTPQTELVVMVFSSEVGRDIEEKISQALRPIGAKITLRERLRLIESALVHLAFNIAHGDSRAAAHLLKTPYSTFMRRHRKIHQKGARR